MSFTIFPSKSKEHKKHISIKKTAESEKTSEDEIKTITVDFDPGGKHSDLKLDLQSSVYKAYDSATDVYYTLTAYLTLKESLANRIEFEYQLLNKSGEVLHLGKSYASSPRGAILGDKIPIFIIASGTKDKFKDLDKVALLVKKIDRKAAHSPNKPIEELNVDWKIEKTSLLDIAFKERNSEIKYNQFSEKILHSLTIEVENKGTAVLKKIKCNIIWFDAAGKKLGENDCTLLGSSKPALPTGYKVPYYTVLTVKHPKGTKPVDYKLELIDVEFE